MYEVIPIIVYINPKYDSNILRTQPSMTSMTSSCHRCELCCVAFDRVARKLEDIYQSEYRGRHSRARPHTMGTDNRGHSGLR